MIKDIKLMIAAGIIPAAIFFVQKDSFLYPGRLEYTPLSKSLR